MKVTVDKVHGLEKIVLDALHPDAFISSPDSGFSCGEPWLDQQKALKGLSSDSNPAVVSWLPDCCRSQRIAPGLPRRKVPAAQRSTKLTLPVRSNACQDSSLP